MLKKAKVVNIQFQDILNLTTKSQRSTFNQTTKNHPEKNLQTYIRSPQSTTETYNLLNILHNPPVNMAQFTQSRNTYDEFMDYDKPKNGRVSEMEPTVPRSAHSQIGKDQKHTVDAVMSVANSTYVDTQMRQSGLKGRSSGKVMSGFYSGSEDGNQEHKPERAIPEQKQDGLVYMIPEKYANGLYLILMHFLTYKMTQGKENTSRTGNMQKRPRTTVNHTTDIRVKHTSRDLKPLTSVCQNRQTQEKTTTKAHISSDLTAHLQKLIQLQKQLQKKSKRLLMLQSQLTSCYETIRGQNSMIKQLSQREGTMRKKMRYEVEKIAKCRVMQDINEIYVKSVKQQKASGRGVFEINGKRFVKSDIFHNCVQSAFITSPKPTSTLLSQAKQPTQKQLTQIQTEQCQLQSKNPLTRSKKPLLKGVNKKLEVMKLTKNLDTLTKEIVKYQAERENLLDDLADNNGKIEKNIQELEELIVGKRLSVERCTEDLLKLREAGGL